jgi:hypothetical protein
MRLAAFREIPLMIFLGAPEFWRGLDLRHNRSRKTAAFVEFFLGCFGRRFLFRRMIENGRTILRADVRTLAIQGRRIMIRPENIEKLSITNLSGIKFHFHNLSVAGVVPANVFVGRVVFRSAGIADSGRGHAFQIAKGFFHTPKTASPKCRFLACHIAMMERLPARRNRLTKLVALEACFVRPVTQHAG